MKEQQENRKILEEFLVPLQNIIKAQNIKQKKKDSINIQHGEVNFPNQVEKNEVHEKNVYEQENIKVKEINKNQQYFVQLAENQKIQIKESKKVISFLVVIYYFIFL